MYVPIQYTLNGTCLGVLAQCTLNVRNNITVPFCVMCVHTILCAHIAQTHGALDYNYTQLVYTPDRTLACKHVYIHVHVLYIRLCMTMRDFSVCT